MPQVRAGGITLEYDVRGEGEPLLLIMGLGAQMTRWPEAFCDKLAEQGFQVIRFDNRDIGLSEKMEDAGPPDMAAIVAAAVSGQKPPVAYDLSHMAADAAALLDALEIERAHIVGASMGGMIAQLVAADYADKVISLASIMSTTGGRDLPPASPAAMAMLNTPQPNPYEDLEAFLTRAVTSSRTIGSPAFPAAESEIRTRAEADFRRSYYPLGFARQYAAVLASPDRRAKLAGVKVPTVVIHGADDPLVPVEGGRDTAKHVKDAELVVIPGMGHDVPAPLYDTLVEAIVTNARRAG